MAGPPGYAYTHRLDTEQSAEDCRDYLRTGRCKYGASCKYNHPSNVQNGGGMKAPINPSEPLYPVRPNEPTCQYYMKHGTCKFGQACKFHHPPQSAVTTALLSGNAVVMNVGRGTEAGSQQILLNSLGSDAATASGVTLQFLPQRPGEPDCIYFLRNGRCKYGASCRYHHPVSVHQRKRGDLQGGASHRQPAAQLVAQANAAEDFGRRPRSSSLQGPTNYSQVAQQRTRPPPKGPPVHYVVGDGQFAVVAVNNRSSSTPQYRQAGDSTEYYVSQGTAAPPGMRQESSSSSIASSYETASSGFDYMSQHGDPNAGGVWIRTRVGSGGSLNTLSENESTQMHQSMMYRSDSRAALAPSVSDNNLVGRNRGESFGSSASDNSARVHPESAAWPVSSGPPPGVRAWPKSGTLAVHPSAAAGDRSDEHHVADEGLSMMTSALLNMLDTPEDAAAKSYTQAAGGAQSPPSTPNEGAVLPSTEGQVHSSTPSFSEQRPSGRMATSSRYTFTANQRVADVRGRGAIGLGHPPTLPRVPAPSSAVQGELRGWSPTWPTPSQAQQLEQTTHAMSVLQQAPEGNTQHTSDVGLYLP